MLFNDTTHEEESRNPEMELLGSDYQTEIPLDELMQETSAPTQEEISLASRMQKDLEKPSPRTPRIGWLVALVGGALFCGAVWWMTWDSPLSQAQKAWDVQNYPLAIEKWEEFRLLQPGHKQTGNVLFLLAQAYEKTKRPEQALPLYQELIEKFPQNEYYYAAQGALGALLFDLSQYREAIESFKEFLKGQPKEELKVGAYRVIAQSYLALGDSQNAKMWYKMASILTANNAPEEDLWILGGLYAQEGNPSEAIKAYQTIVEQFPDKKSLVIMAEKKLYELKSEERSRILDSPQFQAMPLQPLVPQVPASPLEENLPVVVDEKIENLEQENSQLKEELSALKEELDQLKKERLEQARRQKEILGLLQN